MRNGKIKEVFQIIVGFGTIASGFYKEYPTEEEMKKFVSRFFPTFHVDGDPVHWEVKKVYILEE